MLQLEADRRHLMTLFHKFDKYLKDENQPPEAEEEEEAEIGSFFVDLNMMLPLAMEVLMAMLGKLF
jgi:hypothetical protein